jgi:NitT/TauT family transport system permease protein
MAVSKNRKRNVVFEYIFPPALLISVVLVLWQIIVSSLKIPLWELPGPAAIFLAIIGEFNIIYPQIITTYSNVTVGFSISVAMGLSLAILINFYRSIGVALTPFINLLCIIPVITIVPLLMLWVGFDNKAKLIAIVMQSFPIINLNTSTAFANIDPIKLELMYSMRASNLQVLRYCLLPASIGGMFTGIKLASVFAMLAEITSEIAGGDEGLGAQIIKYSSYMKIPETFACIFFVAIFGSIFYELICVIEWSLTRNKTA